jgi:hypothetical protein
MLAIIQCGIMSSRLPFKNINIKIYIILMLPVVLYGCETWSLTPSKEHKLSVFKKRVLRKIFGHKRGVIIGEWRRIHNEELYILCSVERASRYIYVIKPNLMHYLASVYFFNQPLHVSGIFLVPHQEVYCIYTTIGMRCAF